ncbi:hypothetical protein HOD61_00660 [archaeon]|jgi:hypothetical protein|nr:hypothetical protein [archaeon]
MEMNFKRGYIVYKNDKSNFVIAAPHSGPALENATSRDDNSETVSTNCWKKFGGKMIISNMPRNRVLGVDFNRDIPTLTESTRAHGYFVKNIELDKIHEYRKRFAWVAKDEGEHFEKLSIYQNFWSDVSSGNPILFIHRAFPRMKFVPSIIDIISFEGKGVKLDKLNKVVKDLNKEYAPFLKKIETDYKKMILFEEKRLIFNTIKVFKTFDLNKIKGETKSGILKDIEKIKEYADDNFIRQLSNNFNAKTFLEAVDNALKNAPAPRITVEHAFNGSLAFGPQRKLFPTNKTIIEVEPSRLMNFWYPEVVAEILEKLLKRVH